MIVSANTKTTEVLGDRAPLNWTAMWEDDAGEQIPCEVAVLSCDTMTLVTPANLPANVVLGQSLRVTFRPWNHDARYTVSTTVWAVGLASAGGSQTITVGLNLPYPTFARYVSMVSHLRSHYARQRA